MAVYKVQVLGVCGGGEHITLSVKKDGVVIKQVAITKKDILQSDTTWEDAMLFFLRAAIKAAGATTTAQAKTAVEAAQWVI